MKFRKKSDAIEAVQLRWDNWSEMCEHAHVGRLEDGNPQGTYIDTLGIPGAEFAGPDRIGLLIPTLGGLMVAVENDWVVRVAGDLVVCKPDVFEATYEPAQ